MTMVVAIVCGVWHYKYMSTITLTFALCCWVTAPLDLRDHFPCFVAMCSRQAKEAETNHVKQVPTSMFFAHNTALGPPYHVLIDTNFVNFSIKV